MQTEEQISLKILSSIKPMSNEARLEINDNKIHKIKVFLDDDEIYKSQIIAKGNLFIRTESQPFNLK